MSTTPAKRRGRPAHLRVAPNTDDRSRVEAAAQSDSPSHSGPLRDVVLAVHAAPLGRHGHMPQAAVIANTAAFRQIGGDAA
ncbi:MAG: hypothetical protein NVV70_17120 [Cellulomonas sp.]|nr:hypothetical protein [Cellulomonas sp.]MCR6649769.1 hypothetical protein [Cellulomonas sp.]